MGAASIATIGINIVMAASLQLVWKMLGAIQLMVHLPMMAVSFPSNSTFVFNLIIDLANFKIIPTDKIISLISGGKRFVSNA